MKIMKKVFGIGIWFVWCVPFVVGASDLPSVKELVKDFEKPMIGFISSGVLTPIGNLESLPHFSLGLTFPIEKIKYKEPSDQKDKEIYLSLPSLQGRLGIFKGIMNGLGSLDIGGKLSYIPKYNPIKSGSFYGLELRIGILKEALLSPFPSLACSLSYNTFSELKLENKDWQAGMDIKTKAVKLLIGKKFPFVNPYGAIGYDFYEFETDFNVNNLGGEKYTNKDTLFRFLAGCEFNLIPFISLVAEYNQLASEKIYVFILKSGF